MTSKIKTSDLKSYGELEKSFYGGNDSFSFFNRKIQKCCPFTQIPIELTKQNGTADFGYTWSLVVDKNEGDYLTNAWLVIDLPRIELLENNIFGENGYIRWTENIMHNLIEEITLTFNETVVSKLDSFALDFMCEFNLVRDKYDHYMKFIGNIPSLTKPSKILKSKQLFLPLDLFFCKDTGNAIPLPALTNTEIRINIKFRNWESVVILENKESSHIITPIIGRDFANIPHFKEAHLFGTFIIVSEEERNKIGVKTKTMIIEQIQSSPRQVVMKDSNTKIDLLFKQSIKSIFFAVRNTTFKNVWSNYNYDNDKFVEGVFKRNVEHNIIKSASLKYNDKYRVPEMPGNYYHSINPFYHCNSIPNKDGLYIYNFGLSLNEVDPCGGVALSRIDNPTLNITLTEESKNTDDTFELVVVAVSNNILQISEGVVIFPVV